MTEKQNYWNRVGFIKIQGPDGGMVTYGGNDSNGLDIRFEIEKLTGDAVVAFNVGILGLNHDTINYLTVWNPVESFADMRRIEVYAGYENDNISSPIASGYIIQAYPTNPPEMWMNIYCLNMMNYKDPITGVETMYDKTREEIFNKCAEIMKLRPDWRAKDGDKKCGSFAFDCNRASLPEALSHEFQIIVSVEDDALVAVERDAFTETPTGSEPIDLDHGLLQLGNVTLSGASITTRLIDRIRMFSWIHLTSEIVPKASGDYYVIKKRHKGHLRGKEWQTEFTLMRHRDKGA